MLHTFFSHVNRALRAEKAYAHCDIPCGIYDPHGAQLAAMTVLRMVNLMDGLAMPGGSQAEMETYANSLNRYTATKEQHAELCKKELLILWGDYFRPEHLEKYPDLHTTFWTAVKLAGQNKQKVDAKAAQDLVGAVQKVAEIFWATKGASVKRQASLQPVGGEIVVPVPA